MSTAGCGSARRYHRLAHAYSLSAVGAQGEIKVKKDEEIAEIIIGYVPERYLAISGCGMISISKRCREEDVAKVLAHEEVHLVLERLFPYVTVNEAQLFAQLWDMVDLGMIYDITTGLITLGASLYPPVCSR